MSRFLRICLMVLGPGPLAIFSLWFGALVGELSEVLFSRPEASIGILSNFFPRNDESLFYVILGIVITYLITLIPSIVYAITMELAITEGLEPHSWKLVRVSTLLGAICGLCIGALFYRAIFIMLPLGAWVGFVIGLIIKFISPFSRSKSHRRSTRRRKHPREIVHD